MSFGDVAEDHSKHVPRFKQHESPFKQLKIHNIDSDSTDSYNYTNLKIFEGRKVLTDTFDEIIFEKENSVDAKVLTNKQDKVNV